MVEHLRHLHLPFALLQNVITDQMRFQSQMLRPAAMQLTEWNQQPQNFGTAAFWHLEWIGASR